MCCLNRIFLFAKKVIFDAMMIRSQKFEISIFFQYQLTNASRKTCNEIIFNFYCLIEKKFKFLIIKICIVCISFKTLIDFIANINRDRQTIVEYIFDSIVNLTNINHKIVIILYVKLINRFILQTKYYRCFQSMNFIFIVILQ